MDESDSAETLRNKIVADLRAREDVSDFDIREIEDPGFRVEVEEEDAVRLYRVTLEQLPDGTEETHWIYEGEVQSG